MDRSRSARRPHPWCLYVVPATAPHSVEGRRQLRSATTGTLLLIRVRISTGQRSFAVFGPATWNSLPPSLRAPELSLSTFKRLPKTQLFQHAWTIVRRRCDCTASSASHTNIWTQLNSTLSRTTVRWARWTVSASCPVDNVASRLNPQIRRVRTFETHQMSWYPRRIHQSTTTIMPVRLATSVRHTVVLIIRLSVILCACVIIVWFHGWVQDLSKFLTSTAFITSTYKHKQDFTAITTSHWHFQ